MNIFEGYVGIRLWDGQLVDDVIFSLLLFLFIAFSFVFRTNFQLFVKMLKDAFLVTERQNLFDDVIGKSIFFFRNFMTFQVLFPFKYRPDCGRQDIRICELCGMAGGFIGDRNGFLCFIPVLSV